MIALPASIVEPLIAASIVYIAAENFLTDKLTPWRPYVVFGFGLLHGLGFAEVLHEIGLARSDFVNGLIAFNIGVELGQIAVIAIAFLAPGSGSGIGRGIAHGSSARLRPLSDAPVPFGSSNG